MTFIGRVSVLAQLLKALGPRFDDKPVAPKPKQWGKLTAGIVLCIPQVLCDAHVPPHTQSKQKERNVKTKLVGYIIIKQKV